MWIRVRVWAWVCNVGVDTWQCDVGVNVDVNVVVECAVGCCGSVPSSPNGTARMKVLHYERALTAAPSVDADHSSVALLGQEGWGGRRSKSMGRS